MLSRAEMLSSGVKATDGPPVAAECPWTPISPNAPLCPWRRFVRGARLTLRQLRRDRTWPGADE